MWFDRWRDSCNDVGVTYDAIGNPLNDGTRTYTWSAGRQLRHISMLTGEAHGFRASNGVHKDSNTILRIAYDEASSKLKVKLLRDGREITDKCAVSAFVWTKNGAAAGTGREIAVTAAEVNGDAQFGCVYTETQGVYGTVSVDNNLVASHDPAATDANHVFTLENGMLKVEAPDNAGSSADYALNAGTLSINPGFTGTIAAAYEFTTAPTREIEFKYDHNGLRTQKKVTENGVTTTYDYTLHGKLITHLTKRTVDLAGMETVEELHFFYDAQSRPAFVEYNGVKYHYIHNLQDDIVGIVDAAGNLVVEYKYDAWGKPLSITGSLADTLGRRNPFRYRGYVYDEESSFYYLKSRYYSCAMGRFLSADIIVVSNGGLLNCHVYAYCRNAAIDKVDYAGTWWLSSCWNWVSDNIIEPVVEGAKEFVNSIDLTFTVGFNISLSLGLLSYSASIGLSVDLKGNIGVQGSVSTSVTTGDIGVAASTFVSVTNAPTIYDLNGYSTQIGVSATGGVIEGGCDTILFNSGGKDYRGYSVSAGLTTPKGPVVVETHVTMSQSTTFLSGNVRNLVSKRGPSRSVYRVGLNRYISRIDMIA